MKELVHNYGLHPITPCFRLVVKLHMSRTVLYEEEATNNSKTKVKQQQQKREKTAVTQEKGDRTPKKNCLNQKWTLSPAQKSEAQPEESERYVAPLTQAHPVVSVVLPVI
eukprot:Hpha_TRINITY_DN16578_c0_g1::TRINITY_DN16578_c0_g1_i1::g.136061::m.136061